MECRDIQKNLSAYLEGLLSPEEKKIVDRHLPSCAKCSASFNELKRAKELLKKLDEVEPPPWLAAKIMARVRKEKEQRASFFKKLFFPLHIKVPVQALGVILVAVLALQIYRVVEPERRGIHAPSPLAEKKALKEETPEVAAKSAKAPSPYARQNAAGEKAPVMTRVAPEEKDKRGVLGGVSPNQTEPSGQQAYEIAPEDAEKTEALLAKKRMDLESKEPVPAAALKGQPAGANQQLMPLIIVSADDIAAAKGTVEDILKQLGGKEIEKITQGAIEIMIAELPSEKIKELSEKLKGLGDIKTEPRFSELPEGTFRVRIEITSK